MSAIVTGIVEKLLLKVGSYISDQFEFDSGIQKKLKHLKKDLIQIKAVLNDADRRRIENLYLKEWLLSLKDAVYDAEDVLDLFQYKVLQHEAKGKANRVNTTLRRIFNRAPRIRIKLFNDHLNKFNHVVETFKKIVDNKGDMMAFIKDQPISSVIVSELLKLRETTSEPIEREMFGRDNERSKLMELVRCDDDDDGASSSTKNVHVLSIVGMGGMGKTALVQDVYKQVKHQFDLHAWVCVSDNFDVKRLVREIMESASISIPPEFHNLESLDRITNILKSALTGKKFLIVLDDIWGEEKTKWKMLQSVLNIGKEGSRVIITTRFKNIAEMMETKDEAIITLGGLAGDKFWKLFSHYAFRDENPTNHPGLELIGIQIAEKLGGNPLAAKTVGDLLSRNLKILHWREVLDSNKWQTEDGIMSALELSYDYLPSHLKQCFIFCSVFPKDYSYEKDKLIRLWRAHEYLLTNDGETEFNELVSRSFIQDSFSYKNRGYVIHDLLHDLAQSLSDGEIFSVDNKDLIIPARVRHISIHANNLSLVSGSLLVCLQRRT